MTAPVATPAAPTGTSAAMPSADASSMASLQERIINESIEGFMRGDADPNAADLNEIHTLTDSQTPADTTPKVDAKGREHADDGKFKPKPTTDGTKQDDTPEPVEGAEAPPTDGVPAPTAKLVTEFSVTGPDGEALDEGDVTAKIGTVAFKVGDKEYKLPLDRVVRLAQSGVHNEKVYGEAKTAIARAETLEAHSTDLGERIERQNQFVKDLLDNPQFYQQNVERWTAYNSPEARAERAERELDTLRKAQQDAVQGQSRSAQATSFVEKDVAPPLKALLTQYPTLSAQEIFGQFQFLTHKYGTPVHPKDYDAIRKVVSDELPAWAASLHETRSTENVALRRSREANTLLKKVVARGARPAGRAATPADGAGRKAAPRSLDDRISVAIEDALAGN